MTALHIILQNNHNAANLDKSTTLVLLDLMKAFDLVDYNLLVAKLGMFGIIEEVVSQQSFKQKTNSCYGERILRLDWNYVPHGAVLSLLLFDLPHTILELPSLYWRSALVETSCQRNEPRSMQSVRMDMEKLSASKENWLEWCSFSCGWNQDSVWQDCEGLIYIHW